MVELKADAIVTVTTPAVLAIKSVTKTIPVVIPNAIDAVGAGLVASLDHPGGNVTGGTLLQAELSVKRDLSCLRKWFPNYLEWHYFGTRGIRHTCALGHSHKERLRRWVSRFNGMRCMARPTFRRFSLPWP